MTANRRAIATATPSREYYISFGLAYASLALLGMTLSVRWSVARGHYPEDGLGTWGSAGLILGFCLTYADRGRYWPRLPVELRTALGYLVVAVLWLSVATACFSLYTSVSASAVPCPKGSCGEGLQLGLTIMAVICQAGTLAWLLHFNRHV